MRGARFIAAALLLAARLAAASPSAFDEGRRYFAMGIDQFRRHEYNSALHAFQASYRENPLPEVLYNLGLTYRQLNRRAEAAEALDRYLTEAVVSPKRRSDVQALLRELDAGLGQVEIRVDPAGAEIVLDGRSLGHAPLAAQKIDRGTHELTISAEGYRSRQSTVMLTPGPNRPVHVALEKLPTPNITTVTAAPPPEAPPTSSMTSSVPPERPIPFSNTARGRATIALVTIGAASLVTGATLGGLALSVRDDLSQTCKAGGPCDRGTYDRGRQMAISSDVLLPVGAVAVATGALIGLIRPKAKSRFSLAPLAGGGLVVLSGALR